MLKSVRLSDVADAAGVSRGTASNVFSRPEIVREEVRERVLGRRPQARLWRPRPERPAAARRQGQRDRRRHRRAPLLFLRGSFRARRHVRHQPGLRRHRRRHLAGVGRQQGAARLEHPERACRRLHRLLHRGRFRPRRAGARAQAAFRGAGLRFRRPLDRQPSASTTSPARGSRPTPSRARASPLRRAVPADSTTSASARRRSNGRSRRSIPERGTGSGATSKRSGNPGSIPRGFRSTRRKTTRRASRRAWSTYSPPAVTPTAILAMSDKIALHALDWLTARGLSVPHDVSVVGFDGVPEGDVFRTAAHHHRAADGRDGPPGRPDHPRI